MGLYNNYNMSPEQQALLRSRNFTFRPLATAGHLDIWKAFNMVWHPLLAFLFCFLVKQLFTRYDFEALSSLVWWIGTICLVLFPTCALVVLIFGVLTTRLTSAVKWHAVLYWLWWPFWKCAMVYFAVWLGTTWGNYIWYNQFLPYSQLARLQTYGGVNPAIGGTRLQDAGLIYFNASVGVDRSRTGCIKNGATWCVAPIVEGGNIPATEPYPPTKNYDLFMVGVDCCTCPGEFRCGHWNYPGAVGGYRVIDETNREFYRLAAEDFSSTYTRPVRHAIFFEWVADPRLAWANFRTRGYQLMWLAIFTMPFAFLTVSLVLNGIFKYLHEFGLALPNNAPVPPPGLARLLSARFLPQMHKHYNDEREQQNSWLREDPKYVIL